MELGPHTSHKGPHAKSLPQHQHRPGAMTGPLMKCTPQPTPPTSRPPVRVLSALIQPVSAAGPALHCASRHAAHALDVPLQQQQGRRRCGGTGLGAEQCSIGLPPAHPQLMLLRQQQSAAGTHNRTRQAQGAGCRAQGSAPPRRASAPTAGPRARPCRWRCRACRPRCPAGRSARGRGRRAHRGPYRGC